LLTREDLRNEPWPMAAIDERFLMPSLFQQSEVVHGVSYLARSRQIDQIIALDDFDVEMAAHLREHMRLPGLGDSQASFFRDKLAMRTQAQQQIHGGPTNARIGARHHNATPLDKAPLDLCPSQLRHTSSDST
jgi:hypothetical protein